MRKAEPVLRTKAELSTVRAQYVQDGGRQERVVSASWLFSPKSGSGSH